MNLTTASTLEELTTEVVKYTYKPGYRFEAHKHPNGKLSVVFIPHTPDSTNPTQLASNYIKLEYIPGMPVIKVICELVRLWELHEIDEWLQYDGVHINPPHSLP